MFLRGVRIDALGGLPVGVAPAGGLCVRGACVVLGLPVVTDLLVGTLQGRVGRLVRALPVAVLLDRRVMGLGERLLGLLVGPLDGAGQLVLDDLAVLRHGHDYSPFVGYALLPYP